MYFSYRTDRNSAEEQKPFSVEWSSGEYTEQTE